jgi:hypothetical protein
LAGKVTFHADYRLPDDRGRPHESEIPAGLTRVRKLRVCLYEQHGRNDFEAQASASDDTQLSCRDTDEDGNYAFRIPKPKCSPGIDCAREYYLVTRFCAWGGGTPQVCVTANTRQSKQVRDEPLSQWIEYRKLMWSRSYRLAWTDRGSDLVSWNLSCPNKNGVGRATVACSVAGRGGSADRRNSNYGHNKESVHVFYSASQVLDRFGSFIPTETNTHMQGGTHCGGPLDDTNKNWQCQDAVRAIVRDMQTRRMEGKPFCASRRKAKHPNWYEPQRFLCIGGAFQPYAVPHELGHMVHVRWMAYRGGMNGKGPISWLNGTWQKGQTGEGWANFVATATWFSPEARNPLVSNWPMEDRRIARQTCLEGMSIGEMNVAQFFWDLYDAFDPSEPEDEVQLDLDTLLSVWSLFRGQRTKTEQRDHSPGECNPHGRNIKDYLYYYDRMPGKQLPDAGALIRHNCLTLHEPAIKCEQLESGF